MYKSIIFDIGGVLVDFDPKAYLVDRLCNAEMEEKVYDLTFGSEEWQLLDAGKYYFLSRPRRFGKSLLIDTLAELFAGSRALFQGLHAEQHCQL